MSPSSRFDDTDSLFEPVLRNLAGPARQEASGDSETVTPTAGADSRKPPSQLASGSTLAGAHAVYELVELLGSGGMGAVWKAKTQLTSDVNIPEYVALKMSTHAREFASFLIRRELTPLIAMQNPCIVPVIDWSVEGAYPFLVFPHLSHGSLADELQQRGPLGEEALRRLMHCLLEATRAAHRACVLHLDIKPANVLLTAAGGYALTDFGIAQHALDSSIETTPGLGTPMYQSPEQRDVKPGSFDVRTDVWGVGITAYAAAVPFRPDELGTIRREYATSHYGVPDLDHVRADLSPQLSALIMAMVANDRDMRVASAAEALSYLERRADQVEQAASSYANLRTHLVPFGEREAIVSGLVNDMWRKILQRPMQTGTLVRFRAGEVICAQGEQSYTGFVLLSGTVDVYRDDRYVESENHEGTFFGEMAAFLGVARTATIVAQTDCVLLFYNPADFEDFVATQPYLAIRMIRGLCDRLHRLVTRL